MTTNTTSITTNTTTNTATNHRVENIMYRTTITKRSYTGVPTKPYSPPNTWAGV